MTPSIPKGADIRTEANDSISKTNPIAGSACGGGASKAIAVLVLIAGFAIGCKKTPAVAAAVPTEVHALPAPALNQMPLKDALQNRVSARVFSPKPLDDQTLSNLLWAANGINRPATGGRTAPSAYDWRYVDLYLLDARGVARYDAVHHAVERLDSKDIRVLAWEQGFVKDAPLNVVLVSSEGKMDPKESKEMRSIFTGVSAGAIAQNIYLYCASAGLNVVVRASIDRDALHRALRLGADQKIVVAQTVGFPP